MDGDKSATGDSLEGVFGSEGVDHGRYDLGEDGRA